jgi:hypothetical protein
MTAFHPFRPSSTIADTRPGWNIRQMKMPLAIPAVLLLAACATQEQLERDRLTDEIEARVRLPQGARKLSDYARYYAFDEQGMVVGVYAPGYEWPNPDETCGELLEDMTIREIPCPSEPKGDKLLAGQRGWKDSPSKLPLIMDGGCSVVTLLYDPKASEVKRMECNGEA